MSKTSQESESKEVPKGEDPPVEKIKAAQGGGGKTFQGKGKEIKK